MVPLGQEGPIALALLLDRLSWPVKLVRSRAAKAIRALLRNETTYTATTEGLLRWMSEREFESEVASALSIFSVTEHELRPSFEAMTKSIRRPSILTDIILDVMYGRMSGGWEDCLEGTVSVDFKPSTYFTNHNCSHVPPILFNQLTRLETKYALPFTKQWAFEWERLRAQTNTCCTGYPYYFGDFSLARSGIHGQFLVRQSDLYRSAYLRTFAVAIVEWGMPFHFTTGYCLDVLPAVPGLFEMEPVARPCFLGDLPAKLLGADANFEKLCRQIIEIASSGPRPAISLNIPFPKKSAEFGSLTISSFLCSSDFVATANFDPELPNEFLLSQNIAFGGSLPDANIGDLKISGSAGWCVPVCGNIVPIPHGIWHDEYVGAGLTVPTAYVFDKPVELSADQKGLHIIDGDEVIGTTSVWHDAWTPLAPENGNTRCGIITTIAADRLSTAKKQHGVLLGWHVKMSAWENERNFGDFQLRERSTFFIEAENPTTGR